MLFLNLWALFNRKQIKEDFTNLSLQITKKGVKIEKKKLRGWILEMLCKLIDFDEIVHNLLK
jgi:hypothetical protein